MKNALAKLTERPTRKKGNVIIEMSGLVSQSELVKLDALKQIEDNDNYYKGLEEMAYRLVSEKYKLGKKYNKLRRDYNKVTNDFNNMEKSRDRLFKWKKETWKKFKRWFKAGSKQRMNKLRIKIRDGGAI